MEITQSRKKWTEVTDLNLDLELSLGANHTELMFRDPKRFGFVMSRYKFACKMMRLCKNIVEIGCGEGIGALTFLAETKANILCLDFDEIQINYAKNRLLPAILKAQPTWGSRVRYEIRDLASSPLVTPADGVASLDVIEHVDKSEERQFMSNIVNALEPYGIAVIGTPNACASAFASERSRIGHINLFTSERLEALLRDYFKQVFMFSMNDEIVHTGFNSLAHYIFAVGVK